MLLYPLKVNSMSRESTFLKHESCPNCGSRDNLGRFDDGHAWCFGCGYYEPAKIEACIKAIQRNQDDRPTLNKLAVWLPDDVEVTIPDRAKEWFYQYDMTEFDLKNNRVLWSEYKQRMIFPVYDDNNNLLMWQGRYFGPPNPKEPKWLTRGMNEEVFHILTYSGEHDTIVVCEDVISAIKIAKAGFTAMPLWGCVINSSRWIRFKHITDEIIIWLDPDKRNEAVKQSIKGKENNIQTKVILSCKDPKEHSIEEIRLFLS